MKDCCRTEPEEPDKQAYKKWLRWAFYLIVGALIAFVTVNQMNY
jgi:hypothetical protein